MKRSKKVVVLNALKREVRNVDHDRVVAVHNLTTDKMK